MIEVLALRKSFGARPVLRDVSFRLDPGEAAVLIGRSGAGKTTLLRLLAGLERPDEGEVRIEGRRDLPPHRRGLQMVFQDLALYPHLGVLDNVRATAGSPAEALRWLALVGFAGRDRDRPDQLSGGERQRVALARALAARPRLLLLDEPFLNLDPPTRRELLAELAGLQHREGFAVLYVTHHLEESLLLARRLLFLDEGVLELDGPIPEVLAASASPAFDRFTGRMPGGEAPAAQVGGAAGARRLALDPAGEGRLEREIVQLHESLWEARQGDRVVRFLGPSTLQEGQPLRLDP